MPSRGGKFDLQFALSSESHFDNNRKVFMLGQDDASADQTEEEIAQAMIEEITRSKKLAKDTEKAAGKKHMASQDLNGDLASSDEEGGDGATFGRYHPMFDRCRRVNWEAVECIRLRGRSLHEELDRLEWCGKQVYRTQLTMPWHHMP
jgi:hypothetical protein